MALVNLKGYTYEIPQERSATGLSAKHFASEVSSGAIEIFSNLKAVGDSEDRINFSE